MRFPKKVVDTAVRLRHRGMTLLDVKNEIFSQFSLSVSCAMIWKWSQRFAKKPIGVVKNLAERLHADETFIKTYKKGLLFCFWALRCKGMQPVGWHVSLERNLHETKMLMWEARRRFPIGYMPKAIRTDKMPAYPFAIAKVFNHEVKHEKMISFRHGNNVIETFWRCKRRFPKFRTLKSAKNYVGHWLAMHAEETGQILDTFIIRLVKATVDRLNNLFL